MTRNVPCRFHLQGRCLKGDDCQFYHGPAPAVPSQQEAPTCRYYAAGFCAAGESCRFRHPGHEPATPSAASHQEEWAGYTEDQYYAEQALTDEAQDGYWWPQDGDGEPEEEDTDPYDQDAWEAWAVEQTGPEWKDRSLCPRFQATGRCPVWRSCAQPHGDLCETCGRWALHPYSAEARQAHTQACAERADRAASRAASEAQECCICLERVLEKPPAERRFGLLACEHAFCLACVRGWRSQVDSSADVDTALRACPLCRQTCHFVTPSKVWPRSAEEKAAIIAAYKKKLGSIECKYWAASPPGDRRCPFGNSCFYHHEGAELITTRKYISADGEVKFGQALNLADFLGNLGM